MKIINTTILAIISFGLFPEQAQSSVLVEYTFPGSVFTPTTVASGIAADSINATGSSAIIEAGATLPDSLFLRQNILSASAADAIANAQYFQFSLTPLLGNSINLTELSFDAGRGGSSTPRGFVLRTSLDGFSTTLLTADVPTASPTLTPFLFDFIGTEFQNIADPVTFRIYGYAPSTGVGMFYDNLMVRGSVVPEPSTTALLAGGLAFAAVGLRRRRP